LLALSFPSFDQKAHIAIRPEIRPPSGQPVVWALEATHLIVGPLPKIAHR
jgi:hypothetical protein